MSALGNGVLLSFYGDDFTGSTDAMEVTAFAGLRTVLFTRVPDSATRARFVDYDVVGIAGTSRSRSPEWMEKNLPVAFEALASFGAPIIQYKVCSTYDSSPEVGSIGKSTDIGIGIIGGSWSPSVIGAPHLGRWQVFGNLFAAAAGLNYRIDRHPTMSRHPVTPMSEGDLVRHLGAQTDRPVKSVDFGHLDTFTPNDLGEDAPIVFLDVLDERSQALAGEIMWQAATRERLFSASSSGLQYALVAHWRQTGALASTSPPMASPPPVDRLLVLSGSCSPLTADQIAHAEDHGFAGIRINVVAATTPETAEAERTRLLEAVETAFEGARGVVVYAARTVDDAAYGALKDAAERRGVPFSNLQDALGRFMGDVALAAVPRFSLKRVVVAGGDTSGRIVESLPVEALEVAHPLAKGAPLCRCHALDSSYDGLQVALKGGQMGGTDYFVRAMGR